MANILDVKMQPNDAGAKTVGDYLRELLARVWKEEECFSGKRPFGNSGWKWDVYAALIKEGLIGGCLDENGFIESLPSKEEDKADKLIAEAIKAFGN